MLKWIDAVPLAPLVVIAMLLAVLPFNSTPHLIEKLDMLVKGVLIRPIDIFDLLLHGSPLVLLFTRVVRMLVKK